MPILFVAPNAVSARSNSMVAGIFANPTHSAVCTCNFGN